MGACFGCCSVGIRAWRDSTLVFGLDTEACEARLCGLFKMEQHFAKSIKDIKKVTIFDLGGASVRRSIAK